MKILFLANRVPYPPFRGDKLKIYNLARRLKDRHELHLLTFAQTREDLGYKTDLEGIFKEIRFVYLPRWKSAINCLAAPLSSTPLQILYFQSTEMERQLQQLLAEHTYNAIHVQHLRMSPYLANRTDLPRILDLPDAFSLYWERRKSIKRNPLLQAFENMEQKRLLHYENIITRYDKTLVCSQEDLNYLQNIHSTAKLDLLPNGVDRNLFRPGLHDYSHNHTLLFTGNMDYAPNVDAVGYFAEEILPLVRRKYPNVKFIIAGQRPVKKVLDLASENIQVTGFVQDLAAMYNAASVVVAPLRFGAGTQNKVLEAMSVGVPVVCSNIGFAGLGISDGQGAFMRTTPETFADAISELLGSAALREKVGSAGAATIASKFDWDSIALKLEQYFEEVAAHKKRM